MDEIAQRTTKGIRGRLVRYSLTRDHNNVGLPGTRNAVNKIEQELDEALWDASNEKLKYDIPPDFSSALRHDMNASDAHPPVEKKPIENENVKSLREECERLDKRIQELKRENSKFRRLILTYTKGIEKNANEITARKGRLEEINEELDRLLKV